MGGSLSIYVHVPFCSRRCAYCNFTSIASSDPELYLRYFKLLWREIELRSFQLEGKDMVSLYFGGGTPSHVPAKLLSKTLEVILKYVKVPDEFEFTVEVNPEDINEEIAGDYSVLGVNRISIGLQAAQDDILRLIGRPHTFEDFIKAWKILERRFNDINIDFIVGLPMESRETIAEDVKLVSWLRPSHVSVYMLEEEKLDAEKKALLPDEEEVVEHFLIFCNTLSDEGYRRYEISNWYLTKPSFHNLSYWKNQDYIGVGLSAGGHVSRFRYVNTGNLRVYSEKILEGKLPYEYAHNNSEEEELRETLFMCLRLIEGCDLADLEKRFSGQLLGRYLKKLLTNPHYFERQNKKLRLTSLGILHSASAMEMLV
ncbi:MAG: oxygen-independent coproporphyrinogen oxidase [Thermotogota bacterium]|nr:oxygen-independent coproporphyrinogen oxidase [Thermotogota bacterium]